MINCVTGCGARAGMSRPLKECSSPSDKTDGAINQMFAIIGIVIVLGAIAAGYTMEHGNFKVLIQPAELVIIFGAAVGTVVIANPLPTLIKIGEGLPAFLRAAIYQGNLSGIAQDAL